MSDMYRILVKVADILDAKGYKVFAERTDRILVGSVVFALDDEHRGAIYLGYLKFKSFCNFLNTILDKLCYINHDDAVIVRRLFARALKEFDYALDEKYYVPFNYQGLATYNAKLQAVLLRLENIDEKTEEAQRVLKDRFLIVGEFELLYKHLKRLFRGVYDLEDFAQGTLEELNSVLQNVIEKNSEEIINTDLLQFR